MSENPQTRAKLEHLASQVLAATRLGRIRWQKSGSDNFIHSTSSGSLGVAYDPVGLSDYTLRMYDPEGTMVEELDAVPAVRELYMVARDDALRPGELIDNILKDLGL